MKCLRSVLLHTLLLVCFAAGDSHAQLPVDYSTLDYQEGAYVPFADPKDYLQTRDQNYDYEKTSRQSYYITMRDSEQIAVDVYLPTNLEEGKQLPTILYQTRYVRSVELKWLFRPLRKYVTTNVPIEEVYLMNSYGYAVVIVDTRGSGASTGSRDMEFAPNEVKDGAEVCDWIVDQPWSNGNIGASGVSYVATTAMALLANQHPAVKAIFPRCGIWDMYTDVVFVGGLLQGPFVDIWGLTTQSMDANNFKPFGGKVKMAVKGIHPVDVENGRGKLKAAVEDHKENFDIMSNARKVKYRDDGHDIFRLTLDTCSVHRHLDKINAGQTPIYWLTGWYDGAICRGAPNAFRQITSPQKMVLGAWDHDPGNLSSPYNGGDFEVKFDVEAEMIRFFDHHLLGIDNGIMNEPPVRYYTCGEERWNFSDTWPPKWTTVSTYYLNADRSITYMPVPTAARLPYKVDYELGTGQYSRYNSQTSLYKHGSTRYENLGAFTERCLTFTGEPLDSAMTITGNAVVTLQVESDTSDAAVFVYLIDRHPDGTLYYITEGMLRGIQRHVKAKRDYSTRGLPMPIHSYSKHDGKDMTPGKAHEMQIECMPVSYQIPEGHQLVVAVAGHDVDHFDKVEPAPETIHIHCGGTSVSRIHLPIEK